MNEYYPGSKQKVKTYGPDYKPPLQEEDDLELASGKEFSVNGTKTLLYTVGAVAMALNRKSGTIRKWETEGVIPTATYIQPSDSPRGQRRLYTAEQIRGLKKLAAEEGLLYPNANGKWAAVESTQFKAKALQLFRELEGK